MTEHFCVGDKVSAFGVEGVVTQLIDDDVYVHFKTPTDDHEIGFAFDGTYFPWAKEPSLVLVERPKKMVKRKMWANLYSNGRWAISVLEIKDGLNEEKIPILFSGEIEIEVEE